MSTYFFTLFTYLFCTLHQLAQFTRFGFGDCDGFWTFIFPFFTLANVKNCYILCDAFLKKTQKAEKRGVLIENTTILPS
jgi:hypothetical protein